MDSRSGEMMVFVRVVESGSFSAASKLLKLTPSAISKLISRTEERLGVVLFQRSTRQLVLTAEGRNFYDNSVRILDDIDEAEQDITQGTATPQGTVRINASVPFGTHCIVPMLPAFAKRYPDIQLDLSLTDAKVDLQRERVDVAIRVGPLGDASYRARLLGQSRRVVVAAPSYLKAFGTPKTPDQLAKHRCCNFNFKRSLDEWPFIVNGRPLLVPVRGGMLANNGETMRGIMLQGMGIARLAYFHVAEDLKAGRLVELLPKYNGGDIEDIHALFSNQRHMPLRVRALIDFMVEQIGPKLAAHSAHFTKR